MAWQFVCVCGIHIGHECSSGNAGESGSAPCRRSEKASSHSVATADIVLLLSFDDFVSVNSTDGQVYTAQLEVYAVAASTAHLLVSVSCCNNGST